MAGLNYGSSFRMKRDKVEGITFIHRIGKWVVRVKKKTPPIGVITTIAAFVDKVEAEQCYENNK